MQIVYQIQRANLRGTQPVAEAGDAKERRGFWAPYPGSEFRWLPVCSREIFEGSRSFRE
jgi:hypothetical protein